MKGLLYKDFIAVKGKIFLFLTIAQLLLLSLLKITVTDMEIEMIIVNIFVCIMVILFGQVIFFLETSLIKADSKKQTDYILSLPVEKKEYVASKYIYILGAFVYITVICAVEILILKAGQESGDVVLLLEKTWDILPVIAGGFAIVCAVELPFYFILGMEKGAAVKLILIFIVLFGGVAYFFFGNLKLLENFDVLKLINFFTRNKKVLRAVQIITPAAAAGLFFLSYMLSSTMYKKGRKRG